MNRASLIITADDFGLCPEVDAGILDLIEAGVLTAVAVFTNRPFDYAFKPLDAAKVSVGLHLNLSLGRPLTATEQVLSLLDSSWNFHTDLNVFVDTFNPKHAQKELITQLEQFRTIMSAEPSFINFHKHLAERDERLFELMLDVAKLAHNCPVRVRTDAARERCGQRGIATCDYFVGDVCAEGYWTQQRLSEVLGGLCPGVTELMCHPARPMAAYRGVTYDRQRDIERQAFMAESTRQLLAGIRLDGFNLLADKNKG